MRKRIGLLVMMMVGAMGSMLQAQQQTPIAVHEAAVEALLQMVASSNAEGVTRTKLNSCKQASMQLQMRIMTITNATARQAFLDRLYALNDSYFLYEDDLNRIGWRLHQNRGNTAYNQGTVYEAQGRAGGTGWQQAFANALTSHQLAIAHYLNAKAAAQRLDPMLDTLRVQYTGLAIDVTAYQP